MTKDDIIEFAKANPQDFKEIVWNLGFATSNQEWAQTCKLQAMAKWQSTLRDDFAKAALTGLLSNTEAANADGWSFRTGTGALAGVAYMFADDAIAARERK